ncbi:MAG: AraC family transcriptional regulator [Spirochaetia bacterium]|nr:AraC family transcriptional regulator [Spirochaetia bacterium]
MQIKDTVHVYRLVGGDRLAWHGRYHTHNPGEYEFHCFLEGQGVFLLNRSRHRIDGNGLFLTRPMDFHSILPGSLEGPISYYAILFELDMDNPDDQAALALMDRGLSAPARAIEPRDRFLIEELHRLFHEGLAEESVQGPGRAAAYLLLSLIQRWYGTGGVAAAAAVPASGAGTHVNRALAIMERSIRLKLDMGDLAARLGMSEEHFIRMFKGALGMTPFQYFTRLKVEAASSVLVETGSSVGSVAERFGFENPFHFSRVFSKCTGLSPVAYRKTFRAVPGYPAKAETGSSSKAVVEKGVKHAFDPD